MRIEMAANRRNMLAMTVVLGAWCLVALASEPAWAQVRGDFNGDGIADLAIGAPKEGIVALRAVGGTPTPVTIAAAGTVTVIFGTDADGLSAASGAPPAQLIHQLDDSRDFIEPNDQFGAALAAGDFNGDGFSDLAVAVPGDNMIQIFNGGSNGLSPTGDERIHGTDFVDNQHLPLTLLAGLVSGDFNGDGFADLAIKAEEFESIGVRADVIVMPGSAQFGIQFVGLKIFSFNNSGIGGDNTFASVAMTLATGDFSGDGADDLVVGLPFADVRSDTGVPVIDGGTVTIMQGIVGTVQSGGIVTAGATGLTEIDAHFSPRISEHFGAVVATGDFDGDGRADLAIGTPDEDVAGMSGNLVHHGGFVSVFSHGTTLHSFYTQLPLVQIPEANDGFGSTLVTGDFNGDGADELVIGTPNDTISGVSGAGSVTVIYGIAGIGLPRPPAVDLPAINGRVQIFTQATTDIGDAPETGDHFGATLTAANFGKTTHADLVIGIPDEDVQVFRGIVGGVIQLDNRIDAGAVEAIYGSSSGLRAVGSQFLTQNTAGFPDAVEDGDHFGAALP